MAINTVMVIGAGQMGGGIAQVFASIGKKTYLNDIKNLLTAVLPRSPRIWTGAFPREKSRKSRRTRP